MCFFHVLIRTSVAFLTGLKAALGFFGSAANGSEFANQGASFALSMIETSIGKILYPQIEPSLEISNSNYMQLGITVGLFVSTLIVYPKGTQHTPLMNF